MTDPSAPGDEASYLRRADLLKGLFVLFLAIGVAILLNLWSKEQVRPRNPEGATLGTLRGIQGWPDKIDVVGSLDAARDRSKIRELRGITVDGVGSDGVVDLKRRDTASRFVFQGPPQPRPAKPRAAPSKLYKDPGPTGPICNKQVVKLRRKGLYLEEDRPDSRCPSDIAEPLPPPLCGAKEVWAHALTKGAKQDALARLDYFRSKAGPAWKFAIAHERFQLFVSGDCKRELLAGETTGKVY